MQFVLRGVFRNTRVQLGSAVSWGKRRDFCSTRQPEQVQFLSNEVLATFITQKTMKVNGQSALDERQEGTEKSIDAFLLGSAPAL